MKTFEGTIITCDDKDRVCKYLVENEGRIVYVGNELPKQYSECEKIELGSKALVPSFVDSHMHFASFATFNSGLNVMDATSNAQIVDRLKEFVKKDKAKITIAFGASPYSVSDGHLVTRRELDIASPVKPVFFIKYDGHACVVNTPLLRLVEDKVKNLRGYNPESGEMNQEAFFAVSDYITNAIPIFSLIKNMQKAFDYCASKGIGMVHSVSGVGFSGDLDVDLEKWVGRGCENGFQFRIFMQTMDEKKALKRKFPRIGGCFECALDGCFGSKDAALNEPYENSGDYKGVLYYSDEQVTEFCKKANRAGLQIEMHAIGDRAFDQACNALKAALDDYPRENHRHGIIHCCLPTKKGLEICRKYKIQMPVQTSFINWPQEPDEYLTQILGEKRFNKTNPIGTFVRSGIVVSAGSDAPCTDPNPMLWIHNAVNHPVESERISVYQALRMCTYNGYYVTFDEDERGSLEKGKIADMVILSQSPYSVDKAELKNIKAEKLYLRGKEYKKQKKNILSLVLSGMFKRNVKV